MTSPPPNRTPSRRGVGPVGRVCQRCVLDQSIPSIRFDHEGVCSFCGSHDLLMRSYPQDPAVLDERLRRLLATIKTRGRNRPYDCIVGVSGGTDSIYTLYIAQKLGLRPLAVHFDDGWNSEIAVTNIKNATTKLSIDLETYVVDWEEIKSLHRAFLRASVPDPGVPSDVAIHGALYKTAIKEKLKYILGGQSFMTEGTQPRDWSYIDGTYVKSLHRRYGEVPLATYPNATIYQIAYFLFLRGIKQVPFLNYMRYEKENARKVLATELDWQYYGEHHYESIYSQFINAYYNIEKFGIDRRKVTYSGPVRMGKMAREDALDKLREPPSIDPDVIEYCITKLGFTRNEFDIIMKEPPRSFRNFRTSHSALRRMRPLIKLATRLDVITPVLYEKYLA